EVPVLTVHQRLGEKHGIVNDGDHGEKLPVARPVLSHGALVAAWDAIAPVVVGLEMCGCNREHVAFPHTSRESLERVLRILWGMRPPIEVDDAVAPPGGHISAESHQPLTCRIQLAPNAQVAEPPHPVIGGMWTTLVFADHRNSIGVPAVGL